MSGPDLISPVIRTDLRDADGRLCYLGRPLPDGPWHREVDRADVRCAGLTCVLDRNDLGNWAGCVAIPVDHPWAADDLDPTQESGPWDDAVHGGISYCSQRSPISGAVDAAVIWIGFDCAHASAGDLVPVFAESYRGTYRDYEFAIGELCRLADAARAAQVLRGRSNVS